jgi:hypothetical protein
MSRGAGRGACRLETEFVAAVSAEDPMPEHEAEPK